GAKVLLTARASRAYPAKSMRRQQNALADLEISDVFADLGDYPGDVATVDVGQFDARQTFADEQIQMVQRASLHPHQDLVFARTRIGNVLVFQNFRTAELVETNGLHQFSPWGITECSTAI